MFNAARIVKAYGTVARKGDDIPERPHRLSRILESRQASKPVPLELLRKMAPTDEHAAALCATTRQTQTKTARPGKFNLEEFIAAHLKVKRSPVPWGTRGRKWELETCRSILTTRTAARW